MSWIGCPNSLHYRRHSFVPFNVFHVYYFTFGVRHVDSIVMVSGISTQHHPLSHALRPGPGIRGYSPTVCGRFPRNWTHRSVPNSSGFAPAHYPYAKLFSIGITRNPSRGIPVTPWMSADVLTSTYGN